MSVLRSYLSLPKPQRDALFDILHRSPEVFWTLIDTLEAKEQALAGGQPEKLKAVLSRERDAADLLLAKSAID